MIDHSLAATQAQQPALEFEPSSLVEYGSVADLTKLSPSGSVFDGSAYS